MLKLVLDLVPVGVAIALDPQCKEVSLNSAGARMLGRDLRPGDLPLQAAVDSATPLRHAKIALARNDGSTLSAMVSASPLLDENGQVIGAISVFTEASNDAEARAEQFRDLALALADAEARERKRLAQVLHDDFQQLISAAKIRAGILRRGVSEEKLKMDAQQIEQLLETVIAASRALTNELNPPVLYDAGLTAAMEAMARSLEKQHQLKIVCQCDPRAEPEAEQVRVLLFEAVRELLHNVIQHSGAKSVSITTGLSPDGQVQILVGDDGKGFDPARLTIDPSRQRRPFGLIEISERLRWLGGSMEINSRMGKGTSVSLIVPAVLRSARVSEEPHRIAVRVEPISPTVNKQGAKQARILVADDHAIFREGLISLLNHETTLTVIGEAADGQQAVTLARSLRPDILIVDVSMPGLNGLEVTSQLSREMPEMVIVGLSMHERPAMATAMRNAGAAAYLTKDASSETLLSVLRSLVSTS